MATETPTVAFTTLGCKVNQSETDLLARQFTAAGYTCVPFDAPADVYVVNTCTVTHVADRKSRQLLNGARRTSPDALVVATGCYASIVGDLLADGRTMVVRNRDKARLVALVDGRLHGKAADLPHFADQAKYLDEKYLDEKYFDDKHPDRSGGQERTRAMVKVQDGCDSHCTYCIIPRARGRSRSLPPQEVLHRVHGLVREGHGEVVITGVDLGSYGEDAEFGDLGDLLSLLLRETEAGRIRISSLEPGDFKEAWLRLWEDPRLCRHLHVPLQAGSAGVLERMERKYSPTQFARMVELCREAVPGVTITTDVMTGFPGETDGEFEEGLRFIRSIRFDGMHVFKYSKRSGTRAARLPGQVDEAVKSERSAVLREEAAAGVRRLLDRHGGAIGWVAWEGMSGDVWRGLTDTNVRAYSAEGQMRPGGLSRLRLTGAFRDGLWAEPLGIEIPLRQIS